MSGQPTGLVVASTGLLGDAAPLVEAILRRGDSPHTKAAYATDLRTFGIWLDEERLAWHGVTPDDLDRYREWLAARYARATTNRRLSVVRTLYAEAHRRRRIADDPAARLRGLRGRDDHDGGVLTRSEARGWLNRPDFDGDSSSWRNMES